MKTIFNQTELKFIKRWNRWEFCFTVKKLFWWYLTVDVQHCCYMLKIVGYLLEVSLQHFPCYPAKMLDRVEVVWALYSTFVHIIFVLLMVLPIHVGPIVGSMLEAFERPRTTFIFASNICPTCVQRVTFARWILRANWKQLISVTRDRYCGPYIVKASQLTTTPCTENTNVEGSIVVFVLFEINNIYPWYASGIYVFFTCIFIQQFSENNEQLSKNVNMLITIHKLMVSFFGSFEGSVFLNFHAKRNLTPCWTSNPPAVSHLTGRGCNANLHRSQQLYVFLFFLNCQFYHQNPSSINF